MQVCGLRQKGKHMGKKTKIDWCDSTWNPVTGCLHGCEYCYARRIAERFGGHPSDEKLHELMFVFEHPADPQRSAKLSFYDRVLALEINQPGDEKTQRLSCKINHCPFCGRAYGEEET